MTMQQFRAFLAAVIIVVLVGAGYLVWHDTHQAQAKPGCEHTTGYVIGC